MNDVLDFPVVSLPEGKKRLLLLSCCAPCSGAVMNTLVKSEIDFTVLFYNPNIHPEEEYIKRKNENKTYAEKLNVPFVDLDYDSEEWFELTKGFEGEPEKGRRCDICFFMRLERAALYAHENGFDVLSSVLGISRYKDFEQVNRCGEEAVIRYPDVEYWTFNWRKKGGSTLMDKLGKQEDFYRQKYCGCVYSIRK